MRSLLIVLTLVAAFGTEALAKKPILKKPKRGFQVKPDDYPIPPGQDLEWCEYRRLPNKKDMDIVGFDLRMPAGAHHFVIWSYGGTRTDDEISHDPQESIGCAGLDPTELIPRVLVPIQQPNANFRFPEGVGMRVPARMPVWLNPHMKNGGTETVLPDIRMNFIKAKKGAIEHYAEGMIIGNMAAIHVPAGGTQTITAEWTAPFNVNFFHLQTHQHQLGTYANIELVGADGTSVERIYENTEWEHPVTLVSDPAIRLEKGRKIRITCTWENPGPEDVNFGPNTTDEMCFILAFAYRDDGDTTPVGFEHGCAPSDGPGLLCAFAPTIN